MGHSNNTVYTGGGELNGRGFHKWHCLDCSWTHSELGGRKEQDRGQRKANSHRCYNYANDSWSNRKDLQ
jgi:hypothetical protein